MNVRTVLVVKSWTCGGIGLQTIADVFCSVYVYCLRSVV